MCCMAAVLLAGWQLRRIIYCGFISRNTRRRAAIYARNEGISTLAVDSTREKEKERLAGDGVVCGRTQVW